MPFKDDEIHHREPPHIIRSVDQDGLMLCTEYLGFESYDMRMSDEEMEKKMAVHAEEKTETVERKRRKKKENVVSRQFPPPLSSLNGRGHPSFYLRPVRKDGRLKLTKVKIDQPNIFHALRRDARLRLYLDDAYYDSQKTLDFQDQPNENDVASEYQAMDLSMNNDDEHDAREWRHKSYYEIFEKSDVYEIINHVHKHSQPLKPWQRVLHDLTHIVDFCCGSNDFSCLMKEKFAKTGKSCFFKKFDLMPPKMRTEEGKHCESEMSMIAKNPSTSRSKVEVQRRTISPYDLSASDNPGCVISQPSLKGGNYVEWSGNLRISLKARKNFGFVDGSIPLATAKPCDVEDWWANNVLVSSWIKLTIEENIHLTLPTFEVVRDLWLHIQRRYSVKL